ncbi:BP74-related protein [Nocardia arizonensis]
MTYTEDHLDEACGAFLPGCFWCPWSSRLTREIAA